MKKMILAILYLMNVVGYSILLHASDHEESYDSYYEQWAAVPLKHCSSAKEKVECLKARMAVYPEEIQQNIKLQLMANERKSAMELPALKNPIAPLTAHDVALIKVFYQNQ